MLALLIQSVYNIVDSYFVAQYSLSGLTALSLVFPIQQLATALATGAGTGLGILIARMDGCGDTAAQRDTIKSGLWLGVFDFALFACVTLAALQGYFALSSDQPAVRQQGIQYARVVLAGSLGLFVESHCTKLLQARGNTLVPMLAQVTGAAVNMVLDPILIFGWFGLPRMEVAGAAIATVAGQIVAAGAALVLNLKCNPDIHILPREIRWHGKVAAEIYRVGFPSIVMQSIGSAMVFGMNKILFGFTKTATAVFGAYFKLQSFVFMPVFGLNNGMVPIVSYNYGAASLPRVKRTIKLTICTAVAIMAVGCLIFQLFPQQLLLFFNASEEMLSIGSVALRIISVSFMLAGFDIIAGSVCQAIGNPLYSLITSVCRQLVVLLPVAWLLSHTGNLTLVWLAFPISELVSLLLSAVFLRRTMRAVTARIGGQQA